MRDSVLAYKGLYDCPSPALREPDVAVYHANSISNR
jgi:hypothetical protein